MLQYIYTLILDLTKVHMSESILTEKKKYSKILKDYYHFNTKNKATGLILLQDEASIDFLLDGLEVLSCDFVIKTKKQL
jgi:hypothetical protein